MKLMFVDPASKAAGWAVFEGEVYLTGGAVQYNYGTGDEAAFFNLAEIKADFLEIFLEHEVDEVHIEQLVSKTHRYVHWSVGAIGSTSATCGVPTLADVPIQAWQKGIEWKERRKNWKEEGYDSEDHMAAFFMGEYYILRRSS